MAPGIEWLDWSASAFDCAEAENKPILLAISVRWSRPCAVMDRDTYGDAAIAATINDRFVPIRVDADRRPDISERYSLGGWPTTAFLTPAGEILGGGTFMPPQRMTSALVRVADAFRSRRAEIEARAEDARQRRASHPSSEEAAVPDEAAVCWLESQILEQYDGTHGGFASTWKFPHVSALTFALERSADTGDPRLGQLALHTLEAMAASDLCDRVEGGFFRYATGADWTGPQCEKLLDENAAILHLYLDAAALLASEGCRASAVGVLRYVHTHLADRDNGGFYASQAADEDYYRLATVEDRRKRAAPPVDRARYVDGNARMTVAYLRGAEVLSDGPLAEFAIRSLERALVAAYKPGAGVAHEVDSTAAANTAGTIRGLLSDQVQAAAALLAAHDATAREPYAMLAEELVRSALRVLWDDRTGGFFDRVPGPDDRGLLRTPLKPLAANADAARVLLALAALTGNPEFRDRAIRTLASQACAYRTHGLLAAPYARAIRALTVR